MIAEDKRLLDRVVLVTRPGHQAGPFMQLIESHGGQALSFPTIEIQSLAVDQLPSDVLTVFRRAQLIIFTSANAVASAAAILNSEINTLKCSIAAIGRATTKQLEDRGVKVNLQSQSGYDSEALLRHPELQTEQIKNCRILLIKGVGGREKLSNTLSQRGAIVDSLDVYKRLIPQNDVGINRIQLSEQWSELGINAITVTSNESLQNLHSILQSTALPMLLETPLIVPSQRAAALAHELGFRLVYQAISAHDKDMLDALINSGKSQ